MKILILFYNCLIILNKINFSESNQIEVVKFFKNKIEFENGMVVEIPLDKLKLNYPGLTSQLLQTKTVFRQNTSKKNNKFLYYNNETKNFEGVSIHSTFSTLKNISLITTTSAILPRKYLNKLPLYNQFIYTIKTNENSNDLLNDQSEFSSKLRLSLIKEISRNFDLNYTSLKLNWIERLNSTLFSFENNSQYILVSLSNVHLLNLQKIYLNLLNENFELKKIDKKFSNECQSLYENLRSKHVQSDNLLKISKVQFVKLCNLTQIQLVLNESNEAKQLVLAKRIISINTEDLSLGMDVEEVEEGEINYDYPVNNETIILSNLKLNSQVNNFTQKIEIFWEKIKIFFWKIVPEEDFMLAVIVPCIIIISIIVLSIVIICMLQMCKRQPVSDSKHLISPSNTTNSYSSKTFERTNPLYKEKAYLSKGVPVILYEEMSDKPLEELDENDGDQIGSSHFRSPLIMRNEKPPIPAPPEYTRSVFYTPQVKASESILNELQSMLQQSANIISLAETPKELSPTKSIKSIDSKNQPPYNLDNNEENLVLISMKNNKNTSSIVKMSDKRFIQEKFNFS
ncbi:unnamed protein product [Brachionus calyciflorus]|uniref:Uncharacterized protein n=1 Tax=Brachionus calyciflorus TaxID=104777 RepID=A0A813REM2_9BILA|nr:unnamed protein product [Brachionus calyciflorus]